MRNHFTFFLFYQPISYHTISKDAPQFTRFEVWVLTVDISQVKR